MKSSEAISGNDVLRPGGWFLRGGQAFEITQWDIAQPLQLQARATHGGGLQEFSLVELFSAEHPTRFAATLADLIRPTHDTPASGMSDIVALPDALLRRAEAMIQTVEAITKNINQAKRQYSIDAQPISLTELTRQACQSLAKPISLSSYYAYRQMYDQHQGDCARMASALHRSTFGKTKIERGAQHFLDAIIQHFYRTNPPMQPRTVYAIAEQLWMRNHHWWIDPQQVDDQTQKPLIKRLLESRQPIDDLLADPVQVKHLKLIKLPSRSWFYEYVRGLTAQPNGGAETYITRHGQADWEAHFMLFDQFANSATLPLQYVFADHYKLDVLHVDDEFRETLGRLWLTVLIDAFSRAVLGIFLAYEDPGIESIQGALRHAIWPKAGLAGFGINQPWLTFGIPHRLFVDNAWAHHSHSLEDLVRTLSGGGRSTHMELVFRPPYKARYGGLIERLFGNISGQLRQRLPGAILQPDQRHWHNASQGACLLYGDLQRILHQIIVDYMHTPHRDLAGQTPHERWVTGLQLMMPVPPALTSELARCFWRLHPQTRQVTHEGLALFGMHYWDVALGNLRNPGKRGQSRVFQARYDPLNISRIAIFEQSVWLGDAYPRELRLPDGHFEPASLWELEMAKDMVRAQGGRRILRTQSWLIHLLEARELIEQRQTEQKAIRRKVQQLREHRRVRSDIPDTSRLPNATSVQSVSQTSADALDPRAQLLNTFGEVL